MTRAAPESKQVTDRDHSDGLKPGVSSRARVHWDTARECEIRHAVRIDALPAIVFAFLTDAECMMSWLAQDVKADPRPGGMFRLTDFSGFWIEGVYVKVIPYRRVVLTWGGIEGLKLGQSTVDFTLRPNGNGTVLRLRHFGLPRPAVIAHHRGWELSGLLKLKAVIEGREPCGSYLGDIAASYEELPYQVRAGWKN